MRTQPFEQPQPVNDSTGSTYPDYQLHVRTFPLFSRSENRTWSVDFH
jgi:hypothetical protein